MASKTYRVHVGLSYPPHGKGGKEKRAEPGDVVKDLPPQSIPWLLVQGAISELGGGD